MAEFERLDLAGAGLDGVVDRVGASAGESGIAILLPGFVQRLEPRGGEGLPRLVEPRVEVVAERRRMRANLLEVPAELVQHLGFERCQKLVPDDLFRPLADV